MAEPLYGPWIVTVTHVDPFPRLRFGIAGAFEANGPHPLEEGYEVAVDGEEWSLDVEGQDLDDGSWQPVQTLRRETKFILLRGLTVILDTRPKSSTDGWWSGPLWLGAQLTCVSQDPTISTVPTGGLPDFTIPGG